MTTDQKILQALENLHTDVKDLNQGQKSLQASVHTLQTDVRTLQADVHSLQSDVKDLKYGQKNIEINQARIITAQEALAAGQQDIRESMATKDFVEIVVGGAKLELKADNFTYFAPISRKVISHDRRIEELEKDKGFPNPDKH